MLQQKSLAALTTDRTNSARRREEWGSSASAVEFVRRRRLEGAEQGRAVVGRRRFEDAGQGQAVGGVPARQVAEGHLPAAAASAAGAGDGGQPHAAQGASNLPVGDAGGGRRRPSEGDGQDGAPGLESAPGQARFFIDGPLVLVQGGQVGQGERPQVVNQLAVVVGPGLVVEGVGDGVEEDGLAGAALVAGPEVADDVEGVEEPGGQDKAGDEFGHGGLVGEGAVKVHEAGDDAGDAVEDV